MTREEAGKETGYLPGAEPSAGSGIVTEVMLTVTGEQTYADGHKDTSVSRARASLERTDRGTGENEGAVHVLRYREKDTVSGAVTESVMSFSGTGCRIERSGAVSAVMRFAQGEESRFDYGTPFGAIPMSVCTHLVAVRQIGGNFHARIRYTLTPEGGDPIECAVTIRAEPAPPEKADAKPLK